MSFLPTALRSTLLALVVATTASAANNATTAKRPMTIDRPDSTDSPYTIEPGHVQLEMDFANWSKTSVDGDELKATEVAPFELRFGWQSDLELGLFVTPYRREKASFPTGPDAEQDGFGDIITRVKINLVGNDSGDFALGAIADLKLPTGSGGIGNGKFEGGIAVPFTFKVGGPWSGAAMTAFDLAYDGAGYQLVWRNTASFNYQIASGTSAFFELTSRTGIGSHIATFNTGISRMVGKNSEFDFGVNLGLTHAAPDVRVFAGMAHRY